MQLYKIIYANKPSTEPTVKWCGSQDDASKTRAGLRGAGFTVIDTKTVDVPTAKGALIAWLNENTRA